MIFTWYTSYTFPGQLWDSKMLFTYLYSFLCRAAFEEHTRDSVFKNNKNGFVSGLKSSACASKHTTHTSSSAGWVWLAVMESHDFLDHLKLELPSPDCVFVYSKHHVHRLAATDFFWPRRDTYPAPAAFWGLLLWNSISSTVHTAPFTFSSRTKHLWRLRLCLTAFWSHTKKREMKCKLCLDIESWEHNLMKIHLPGGCVAPEIGKVSREPVVDFI